MAIIFPYRAQDCAPDKPPADLESFI